MWLLPAGVKDVLITGNAFWTVLNALSFAGLLAAGILAVKRKPLAASLTLALDLVFFVLVRGKGRSLFLEPFSERFSALGTNTQYGTMALFFVVLAAGLALVAWMVWKNWKELKA